MPAYQGVAYQKRPAFLLLLQRWRRGGGAGLRIEIIAVAVDIQRNQSLETPLRCIRQIRIGLLLVCKQGIAADLGNLDRVEQRCARRDVEVGIVAVPIGTAVSQS